ncbi:MAG: hypothetical protein H6750_04605 [Nitrospiraceae bacterium]|nr:hypothetical protein [Nitrospira sp.]MCB9773588.1 hypothetical protein [Nitrospiraceae bacterium]
MGKQTKKGLQPSRFFRVKNFERFQHYKKRCPPWIKLYYEILDDDAFISLPLEAQLYYLLLLLIAGRRDNVIPLDSKYLKKVMRLEHEPDLKPLFESGFLLALSKQQASKMLADRKQNALSETESEAEREKRRKESEEKGEKEGLGEGEGRQENQNAEERLRGKSQGINGERANQAENGKTSEGGDRRAADGEAFQALEKLREAVGIPKKDGFQPIGNPLKAFQRD